MMKGKFAVIIADDPEHEKVFAEVHCGGKFIAQVSQEQGPDQLILEFPGPVVDETQVLRQVTLAEFVYWIDVAAKKLIGGSSTQTTGDDEPGE